MLLRSIFCTALLAMAAGAEAGDWRLAGTLPQGRAAALIVVDDEQIMLRVGEIIADCQLLAVYAKQARFQCGNEERVLVLGAALRHANEQRNDLTETSGLTVTLDRQEVAGNLADRQRLVSGISLQPVIGDASIAGYRLLAMTSESLASKTGFRVNDVLRSINGVATSEGGAFMQQLNNLADVSQVLIGFERAGHVLQTVVLLR